MRGQVARLPMLVITVLVITLGRDTLTVSEPGLEEACSARSESGRLHTAKASVVRVASRRNFLVGFIK
ncbi:MAG: hypothetical protein NVS1B5_07930 [Gemmatimonadaceae bacterium]